MSKIGYLAILCLVRSACASDAGPFQSTVERVAGNRNIGQLEAMFRAIPGAETALNAARELYRARYGQNARPGDLGANTVTGMFGGQFAEAASHIGPAGEGEAEDGDEAERDEGTSMVPPASPMEVPESHSQLDPRINELYENDGRKYLVELQGVCPLPRKLRMQRQAFVKDNGSVSDFLTKLKIWATKSVRKTSINEKTYAVVDVPLLSGKQVTMRSISKVEGAVISPVPSGTGDTASLVIQYERTDGPINPEFELTVLLEPLDSKGKQFELRVYEVQPSWWCGLVYLGHLYVDDA